MTSQFIIKKGLSTNLFDDHGNCKISQDQLIENGWYLTTDTAEVYVALRDTDNILVLRKLNDISDIESFDPKVSFVSTFANLPNVNQDTETMYVVNNENATYRWTGSEYICVGRDYNKIQVIFGGDANTSTDD